MSSVRAVTTQRMYVALSISRKDVVGETRIVILTPEEMQLPSAEVTQRHLGADADLTQWDVKMSIKFDNGEK